LYTMVTPDTFAFLFNGADLFREVVFFVRLIPKFTFYFLQEMPDRGFLH
jgi:hypothetical protein